MTQGGRWVEEYKKSQKVKIKVWLTTERAANSGQDVFRETVEVRDINRLENRERCVCGKNTSDGRGKREVGKVSEREGGGMATSQSRLSDTAHQSSIEPADRYFQHEMTHQLYCGGVGERHTETRESEWERQRWGGLYLFNEDLFKQAGQSRIWVI